MENKEIFWQGEDGLTWRATLGMDNAVPCIFDLSYKTNGAWVNLAGCSPSAGTPGGGG